MDIDDIIKKFNLQDLAQEQQDEEMIEDTGNDPLSHNDILLDILKSFTMMADLDQNIIPNLTDKSIEADINKNHNQKIVVGPDGTEYLVDDTGLWINLSEVENKDSLIKSQNCTLNLEVIYADNSDEKCNMAFATEESDSLLLTIYIPHNSKFELGNQKNITDSYFHLGMNTFPIDAIGTLEMPGHFIPTCKYYSSDFNNQEKLNTVPSFYYKFDKPFKMKSDCSNRKLIELSNSSTCECSHLSNQTKCHFFEEDIWENVYTLLNNEQSLSIQKKRYGHGTYRYRLMDDINNVAVINDTDTDLFNNDSTYCSFEDFENTVNEYVKSQDVSFQVINLLYPDEMPKEVYTQYVANA